MLSIDPWERDTEPYTHIRYDLHSVSLAFIFIRNRRKRERERETRLYPESRASIPVFQVRIAQVRAEPNRATRQPCNLPRDASTREV